jgi:hypothetical protein
MAMTRDTPLPLLEWGVASLALPGQAVCGDRHLVQPFPNGVLVAVVDGVGHGEEAASAAAVAIATMAAHADEAVVPLLRRCHEALRETRGAAITVGSFNALHGTMTGIGVGTVQGVLLRADRAAQPDCEPIVLHGGVVGLQLPPLHSFVVTVAPGDSLVMATDGIRGGFAEGLSVVEPPQRVADRILARDAKGTDDALVLVARYLGGLP